MISFRYHIVSIVSVFLALAVGVALGGGPLKGEVDNTLVQQVQNDRQEKVALQSQISDLRSTNGFSDQFAAAVAPTLLDGTLRRHTVSIVVLPGASEEDVKGIAELVGVAGGTVGSTLRVGDQLVDAGDKQLVDELGNQLESQASGLDVPPDASAYERMGALIARAFGTTTAGGAAADSATSAVLAGLTNTKLLSADGEVKRRSDLFVFVGGPGRGNADTQQGTSSITTALAAAVDSATAGVVVAGPPTSARDNGVVKAVRDDVAAARDVSTVDALGRVAGRVVTIMALAGQAEGRTGHYGGVDAADGAAPGAQTAAG